MRSLLSDKEWLVEESAFNDEKLNYYETIFTVGNGYLGTRGSLEEGHQAGLQGTYLNGVFDHHASFIVDLVNAPDWTSLSIWVDGNRLDLHSCEILEYRRILDLKQGLLYRITRFKDAAGRITRYESIRYANFSQRHLFEVNATLTAENYSADVTIESDIDGQVYNIDLKPAYKVEPRFSPQVRWLKWSRSKHLAHVEAATTDSGVYLELKTLDRPHHIGYASAVKVEGVDHRLQTQTQYEKVGASVSFDLQEGQSVNFQKLTAIYTSRDVDKSQIRSHCTDVLQQALQQSAEQRLQPHLETWQRKWDDCDIRIDGDAEANRAVRFNIYHLLITANEFDHRANIGAKSLSGEGYKGHVFWDTEIFMLPFYIYTQPETARALLMYRYHTMPGARDYARENGNEGARYPWESADTGHEVTPPWTADGKERIWTGERELHITSAIAFGVLSYVNATGDTGFLVDYGAEILFETARFWSSRMEYKPETDRYELTDVEGPDEFHELVDNSVYTNWLVKWNLQKSARYYHWMKENHPSELARLNQALALDDAAVAAWQAMAEKIYIPFKEGEELIEQFEGYFQLDEIPITEWDENNMPFYPEGYNHFNSDTTTLIKQPDVVMLLYVLPDEFSDAVKRANYEYYEARTMHKSSLSPAIHTIMGIETNHFEKALQYFERAAFVDLVDNQGNTLDGIHIASAGGTWQAMVNGFGGMRVKNRKLTFKPWLPDKWGSISYGLQWRSGRLDVSVSAAQMHFTWRHPDHQELAIMVQGKDVSLPPNQLISVALN
ncbi:MAG: glycosyl hydrolase family 65 protein [Pseudomonadota bacterium]